MDEASVLNTFETYRVHFDRLFKEREHKYQTTNYMTIDHYHIMDILNKTIRDSMMKKLAEVYNKSGVSRSNTELHRHFLQIQCTLHAATWFAHHKWFTATLDSSTLHGQVQANAAGGSTSDFGST